MSELTDEKIEALLCSPKTVINPGARKKTQMGSEQLNYEIRGQNGALFRLYVRQNLRVAEGFSCGLLYEPPGGEPVTLTRYNGSDHSHGNPLENGEVFHGACHIHKATERYIQAGRKSEHFAETTNRYTNLDEALRCLLSDCRIEGLEAEAASTQLILI